MAQGGKGTLNLKLLSGPANKINTRGFDSNKNESCFYSYAKLKIKRMWI